MMQTILLVLCAVMWLLVDRNKMPSLSHAIITLYNYTLSSAGFFNDSSEILTSEGHIWNMDGGKFVII